MLLAEALAAKKDALTEVSDLRERLAAAAVRYEDQDAATEDPADLVAKLTDALDRVESLTVRVNRTNNETSLGFDGRNPSIMEAVALRDRLTLEAKIRRGIVEAVEEGLETKSSVIENDAMVGLESLSGFDSPIRRGSGVTSTRYARRPSAVSAPRQRPAGPSVRFCRQP